MIGNVIKSIRIVNNKSETEFARSLNVSHAFISKIEKGEKRFSLKKLQKVSEIYNIPVSKIQELDKLDNEQKLSYMQLLKYVVDYYLVGSQKETRQKK